MQTSRRGFLKLTANSFIGYSALSTPLFSGLAWAASGYTGRIPICQLMTNAHSTQITVLTESGKSYAYRVCDSQGKILSIRIWDHDFRNYYHQGIDKLWINGLQPGQSYYLQVIDKDRGNVLDERIFRSLSLDSGKSLKFALVSCAFDFYTTHAKVMWDHLFAEKPDMIFLIGDSVYADLNSDGTEHDFWRRYCETRSRLRHFLQPELIPTLTTWDDHDYGKNNASKNFPQKMASRRIFDLFWGCLETEGLRKTTGVGFEFNARGQKFCFMDDRYFRDEPRSGGMMWGDEQQESLLSSVNDCKKPTWILNGSQYFGYYKYQESFSKDYPKNFAYVLNRLSKCEAPVAFASGDVHFSEVLKLEPRLLGYQTFEYTSSSIHSINIPITLIGENPRRECQSWHHNFLIIKSTAVNHGMKISTRSIGAHQNILFEHHTTVIR
ncbi:MAG: phosphodiesterase [Bacillota bacterium]